MIQRLTLCEASFKVLYRQPLVRLQNSVTPFQRLQNLISLGTLSYKCQSISYVHFLINVRVSPYEIPLYRGFLLYVSLSFLPNTCLTHVWNHSLFGHLVSCAFTTVHFEDRAALVPSSAKSVNTNCQWTRWTKLFEVQNSLVCLTHLTVDIQPNLLQGQRRTSKQWMIQNMIYHHKKPTEWFHKVVSWTNLSSDRKRINEIKHSLICELPAHNTNTGITRLFSLNTPKSPWGRPNFGIRNLAHVFPTMNGVQNERKGNTSS
jgi:hypothetical protein